MSVGHFCLFRPSRRTLVRPQKQLLGEAINDICAKYGKPQPYSGEDWPYTPIIPYACASIEALEDAVEKMNDDQKRKAEAAEKRCTEFPRSPHSCVRAPDIEISASL